VNLRIAPAAAAGLFVLAGLNAWLVSIVALGSTTQPPPATTKPNPGWHKTAEAVPAVRPVNDYNFILAHPVFYKSREPYVPPPPPPPPPPPKAAPPPPIDPGLTLGGIVINRGIRKAYLLSKADPRGEWRQEGDNIMGWTLQSVAESHATLRQQDRTIELHLYPKN
jgi:hypothetical protein